MLEKINITLCGVALIAFLLMAITHFISGMHDVSKTFQYIFFGSALLAAIVRYAKKKSNPEEEAE